MEIYDLIKSVIERVHKEKGEATEVAHSPQVRHKHLHIEQVQKTDGSTIIIVDYEEA